MKKSILAMVCTGLFFIHHIYLSSASSPNNSMPLITNNFKEYIKQTATGPHKMELLNESFEINPVWLEGAIETISKDLSIKNKPEAVQAITKAVETQLKAQLDSSKKTVYQRLRGPVFTFDSLLNPLKKIIHNAVWSTYTRIEPLPQTQKKSFLPAIPIQKEYQQKTKGFATTDKIPHDKTIEELFNDSSAIPQEAQLILNNPETGEITLSEYGIIFINTIINLAYTIKKSLPNQQTIPDQETINKIIELAHHPFLQNSDPDSPSLVFFSPYNINPFTYLFNHRANASNFTQWNQAQNFKQACKFIHTKVNEFPTVTYYHEPQPVANQEEKIEEQPVIQEIPNATQETTEINAPVTFWEKAQPKINDQTKEKSPRKIMIAATRKRRSNIKRMPAPITETQSSQNINEPYYEPAYNPIHGWNPFNWDWKSIYSSAGALWTKIWS